MNKKFLSRFFSILAATVMAVSSAGCDDSSDEPYPDVIWDISGVGFTFEIVDSKGANLLDTQRTDNAVNDNFYVLFDGKKYEVSDSVYQKCLDNYEEYLKWIADKNNSNNNSRAVLVSFDGLQIVPIMTIDDTPYQGLVPTKQFQLTFGEFHGDSTYDHTMTLVWPEKNLSYEFRINNTFRWKNHEPDIDRHFYFNGKEVEPSWWKAPIRITCP